MSYSMVVTWVPSGRVRLPHFLAAPQEVADASWRGGVDDRLYVAPCCLVCIGRARQLESVNMDDQHGFVDRVPEHTGPLGKWLVPETLGAQRAFVLPICSCVGMSVQGLLKGGHWASVAPLVPFLGPTLARDFYPREGSLE